MLWQIFWLKSKLFLENSQNFVYHNLVDFSISFSFYSTHLPLSSYHPNYERKFSASFSSYDISHDHDGAYDNRDFIKIAKMYEIDKIHKMEMKRFFIYSSSTSLVFGDSEHAKINNKMKNSPSFFLYWRDLLASMSFMFSRHYRFYISIEFRFDLKWNIIHKALIVIDLAT